MSARPRRIVFRLELGGAAGWGHLARSSALAAELDARGWRCGVWTDGDLAAAPEDLRAPFVEVRPVLSGPGDADWIVVDYYGISDAELRGLRRSATGVSLLVIDDDAVRLLDAADVVVNARLGLATAPYACPRVLLGERYAMLRAGLRTPSKVAAPFTTEQVPVLVMLGGTDPRGLTATVVDALADVDARRLVPIVLRSRALAGGESVTRALERFRQHVWLERLDAAQLAGWAGVCRYAVSACGGALYELAYLGLPFVGVVVADNQRAMAGEVAARWQLPVVDTAGNERAAIVAALRRLLPSTLTQRASVGGIDHLGTARIADVIEDVSP